MILTDEKLVEILQKTQYVKDVEKTWERAQASTTNLSDYLLSNNILTKDLLGQAVSEYLKVKYLDLNTNIPNVQDIEQIPVEIATKYRVVFYKKEDKKMIIATDSVENKTEAEKELKTMIPGVVFEFGYSLTEDIDNVLLMYREELTERLDEIIQNNPKFAPALIDEIFHEAILRKASDIHMEPQEDYVLIRYRVDGVLARVAKLDKSLYPNLVNRIKVMARLRVDDRFSAQDGAIRYEMDDVKIDMRVSVAPVVEGEKVSIRVLSSYLKSFSLKDIGLSELHQEVISQNAKKPFGMILACGPTGSGKTTTLYAILNYLNQEGVNITTIEDPVEYKIKGVNQIQVNKETNLTFAKGLRSIVRQDPDIILVGEIRDQETAEIGVNAAMTGHLLLSTFHSNDAATAIPRLLDMGIEPFLLASGLELIIAQRLVRKICEKCRTSYDFDTSELANKDRQDAVKKYFGTKKTHRMYKGKGCSACNNTGYKGRIGIFEVLNMSNEIKEIVMTNPSSDAVWNLARKAGTTTFFEDGIEKVKAGITTLDEVFRVAPVTK